MAQFNFLSGSSIDNVTNFVFDALQSGDSYIGYAKGVPEMQWGINALVYIDHTEVNNISSFPSSAVAKGTDTYTSNKFFDLNSVSLISGANDTNREVFIGKVANTDTSMSNVEYFDSSEIGSLKLSYIGKNWAVIEGLSRYYYNLMTVSASASYYVFNFNKNKLIACKIMSKSFVNIPYYTTNCNLYIKKDGESDFTLIKTNIQRTINIIGESYVSGLNAPENIEVGDLDIIFSESISGTTHKSDMLTATFLLKDESGNILIDNMSFVDPEVGNPSGLYTEISSLGSGSKYLTFKYPYVNSELQYIKFMIGSKQNNELAIWNEVLPFDTAIPTSDSNPPGLDVSYLKNPLFAKSIFDIKGIIKIEPTDVEFVKEMFNDTEKTTYQDLGFEIETIDLTGPNTEHLGIIRLFTQAGSATSVIPLNDFHTFVVGDVIEDPIVEGMNYTVIGVDYSFGSASIVLNKALVSDLAKNYVLTSTPSDISARVTLAKTSDKEKALKHGLPSVLISKSVDLTGINSPTEDIYRQLFISYKPKDNTNTVCTDTIYRDMFDINNFEYHTGTVLYVSNKIPVYRKWANIAEEFKIIL